MPSSSVDKNIEKGTLIRIWNLHKKHGGSLEKIIEEMGITRKQLLKIFATRPRFAAALINENRVLLKDVQETDTMGRTPLLDELDKGQISDDIVDDVDEDANDIADFLSTEDSKHNKRYKYQLLGIKDKKSIEMFEGLEEISKMHISETMDLAHGGVTKVLVNATQRLQDLQEMESELDEVAGDDPIMKHQLKFVNHKMFKEVAEVILKATNSVNEGIKTRIEAQKKVNEMKGKGGGKSRGKPGFASVSD